MTQQVQELIDKIKKEGVEVAENQSSEIVQTANQKAETIVREANQKAEQIIEQAKTDAKRSQESAEMSIQQAGRDILITLRQDIEQTLNRIVAKEIKTALSADHLADILSTAIKGYLKDQSGSSDIKAYLSDGDLDKLGKGFVKKLQDQVKQPITLSSSSDVEAGFTISFDGGKSSFDFTDESLAQFLNTYLNEEIASLLNK